VTLPSALEPVLPGLLDAFVTEPLLDVADQPRDALDHDVVEQAPFGLHLLAQRSGAVHVAAVECLDRAIHRRPGHLGQLLV
jgi:hypothetical protein